MRDALDRVARRGDRAIVLAVSGGPDSVYLARRVAAAWTPSDPRVIVACVDHGVRQESAEELAFTARLAADLSMPFRALRADNSRVERRGRINEARLRGERYRLLEATALEFGARSIWLAHHRDDQCETILLAALRAGSKVSLAALGGMRRITRWRRDIELVRPFLALPRATIHNALTALNQPFCCDSSNRDPRFLRNRVRLELLPTLKREFGLEVERRLLHLGRLARALDRRAKRFAGSSAPPNSDTVYARLLDLCQGAIPSARVTDLVFERIDSPTPTLIEVAPGIRVRVGRGAVERTADQPASKSSIYLRSLEHADLGSRLLTKFQRTKARGSRPNSLHLDVDRVRGEITLRTRRDGDRVHLSQRRHDHKLKDLFANAGIAVPKRDVAHVLEDQSGIVAVENLGIAKRVAITATTRRVLRIQFLFDRESSIG